LEHHKGAEGATVPTALAELTIVMDEIIMTNEYSANVSDVVRTNLLGSDAVVAIISPLMIQVAKLLFWLSPKHWRTLPLMRTGCQQPKWAINSSSLTTLIHGQKYLDGKDCSAR
jgi:hypothetical protein